MNLNWSHVQDDVKNLIEDSAPARHLLKAIKFSSVQDHKDYYSVLLSVENKLTLQMCERLFLPQLKHVLELRLGLPIAFEFSIQSRQEPFQIIDPALDELVDQAVDSGLLLPLIPRSQQRFQFKSKYSLNPRYQISTFCVTNENDFAKSATEKFVTDDSMNLSVMVLLGPSGTGKTHLLNATGWNFLQLKPHLKVKIISGDDLITDFQAAIFRRTMTEFRLKYRLETDVLLIDDIHCLERAKATQTELFNLINEFQNAGKKIILTCDRSIHSSAAFDERLKSRLLGSLNVELEYPTYSAKETILKYKLKEAQLDVTPEILQRVLASTGPCIRSLEGALHRIHMLRQTSGRLDPFTLDKMFPAVQASETTNISVDALVLKICGQHQVSLKELKGTSRKRPFVLARRDCAVALKTELGKATADIGRILQRDHSTVISLLKSYAKEKTATKK